jgi:tetratricopeptide (TPR) repeat protein
MARHIVGFLVLTLVAGTVCAQGDWSTLTHNGEYAFARGFMDRAEKEFQAALEVAQQLPPGDRRLEISLDNLARLYEHESEFAKAQPLYQLKLAAAEARLGTDDPGLLDPLYDVARVSQPLGDLPEVDESLQRFDAIARATGAADPRQWWQALAMLARMQVIREDQETALAWQRRAVEVLAEDGGATPEERVAQLESLAQLELEAGDGERAAALFLEVAEVRAAEEGPTAFAETLVRGASAAFAVGRFETAEQLAMTTLELEPEGTSGGSARAVLADVSWARVSRGTDDLEILLAATGDDPDLALAAQRLHAVADAEGGADNETLTRLVQVETLRGNFREAVHCQRQLVATAPTQQAEMAARRDLCLLLTAEGDYGAALTENTVVLEALERELGPDDPRLLPILEQRLDILERTGPKKEAKRVKKRIKKILR